MDKQLIFFKTEQGREALTSRPAGLGPRLRSLLIMVDGKRSVAEFDKLLGADAAPLLEQLAAQGWHVLRFDYFGTGDSAGEFDEADLTGWEADIEQALDELLDMAGARKVALVGLRLGATLAARVAARAS